MDNKSEAEREVEVGVVHSVLVLEEGSILVLLQLQLLILDNILVQHHNLHHNLHHNRLLTDRGLPGLQLNALKHLVDMVAVAEGVVLLLQVSSITISITCS